MEGNVMSEELQLDALREIIADLLIDIQDICANSGLDLDGITLVARDTGNDNKVILLTNERPRDAFAVALRTMESEQ